MHKMQKITLILILIFIMSCSTFARLEGPPTAIVNFNGGNFEVAPITGCWQYRVNILVTETICHDISIHYEDYIGSAKELYGQKSIEVSTGYHSYTEPSSYMLYKYSMSEVYETINSGEYENGLLTIELSDFNSGIYIVEAVQQWRGMRDAFYVFALKI